jgi:pimeloyl-ACP methyl ester carboxylesterase
LFEGGHNALVVVAHGVTASMRHPDIARVVEYLAQTHDVLAFDFRGHGASTGHFEFDFDGSARDLAAAVNWGREKHYQMVAVVGYSLGAASALFAAAKGVAMDAVVLVSCPTAPPFKGPVSRLVYHRSWYWFIRLMGTRLRFPRGPVTWPIDIIPDLPSVPTLVVHTGQDSIVPEQSSELLFESLPGPKRYMLVPEAKHARLTDLRPICAWLDEVLSPADTPPAPQLQLAGEGRGSA